MQWPLMRIALTVFGQSISPLFDSASRWLCATVQNGTLSGHETHDVSPLALSQKLELLRKTQTQVLVCGAISAFVQKTLRRRGIEVCPWVCGNVEQVLQMFALRFDLAAHDDQARRPRVAIPVSKPGLDAPLAPTLAQAEQLLLVDLNGAQCGEVPPSTWTAIDKDHIALAHVLLKHDVVALLAGRCGPNTLGALRAAGIEFVSASDGNALQAVAAFATRYRGRKTDSQGLSDA